MKTLKLTDSDVHFLKYECKNETINNYLSKGVIDEKTPLITLVLPLADLEIFEDELLKVLTDIGIGQDGEINDVGKRIDYLLDRFNHYK